MISRFMAWCRWCWNKLCDTIDCVGRFWNSLALRSFFLSLSLFFFFSGRSILLDLRCVCYAFAFRSFHSLVLFLYSFCSFLSLRVEKCDLIQTCFPIFLSVFAITIAIRKESCFEFIRFIHKLTWLMLCVLNIEWNGCCWFWSPVSSSSGIWMLICMVRFDNPFYYCPLFECFGIISINATILNQQFHSKLQASDFSSQNVLSL